MGLRHPDNSKPQKLSLTRSPRNFYHMEKKDIYVSEMANLGQVRAGGKSCCDDSMGECDFDYQGESVKQKYFLWQTMRKGMSSPKI